MNDTLPALALVIGVIGALALSQSRSLLARIAIEVVFLGLIGAFLLWHETPQASHSSPWVQTLGLVWWLIGARFVVNLTTLIRGHDPHSREARLFSDLSAAVIYITTALVILNSVLGLNVTGLVATSGLIAIVVGLALQNTLSDVFSGIAVGLEQPFHVGDRVSLDGNVEGKIVEMNWRSVRIQTDADDLAAIPNSLVAKGYIINRSVPTRRRAASIEIVAPSEVPAGVVFEQMRQATLLCSNVLSKPAPTVTIKRSGIHSSTYVTEFFVADSPDLLAAKSTLLRQTRRMFRYAGISRGMQMTREELLRSLVLFEALSDAELETVARQLIINSVEPGDVIFEQGADSTSIYVIEDGVMEITRNEPGGTPRTIGRIGPGEYVGEIGLITAAPRRFTLRALTHGRIAELSGARLSQFLKANAPLSAAMERSVRRGLEVLDRDDAARTLEPVEREGELGSRIKAFFGLKPNAHGATPKPQRGGVEEWPRDATQFSRVPSSKSITAR